MDKTGYIIRLLEDSEIFFLGRPRRFGKSLFLSTLDYFFRGERELFRGLAIDSYPDWNWEPYPVIRLDLGMGSYAESDSLKETLDFALSRYEKSYGISPSSRNIYHRFQQLILTAHESTGKRVVVLVDEYEKPIIDMLDRPEIMELHRETLRGFYSVLKGLDSCLRLVFLTGVTKFGQMNVFSGLNNIKDISLDDKCNAICGVTEEELRSSFKEGIEALAREYETDYEGALNLLKKNYDGYHFSKRCPDIYNPFSLISALSHCNIRSYWAASGTPTLLVKVLLQKNLGLLDMKDIEVEEERLSGVNNRLDDPVALFYQTGYLTIKSYDRKMDLYRLGFPNKEVADSFMKFILPSYCNLQVGETDSFLIQLARAFYDGKPDLAMELLEEFSASISYDMIPVPEVERHFQYMMYLVCKLLLARDVFVRVEEKTSDGRIDILVESQQFVYVIEIKRDSSPQEALRQILEKEYALPYRHDGRKIFLVGVNFSTEKKRLDGFITQEFQS